MKSWVRLVCTGIILAAAATCTGVRPAIGADDPAVGPIAFPGLSPSSAQGDKTDTTFTLSNNLLSMDWESKDGALLPGKFTNRIGGRTIDFDPRELFRIVLVDGTVLKSSEMKTVSAPAFEKIQQGLRNAPGSTATRFAAYLAGMRLQAVFSGPNGNPRVEWQAILLDGSNYIRQEIVINAAVDLPVKEVQLFQVSLPDAKAGGHVDGSPITTETEFLGFEHPMSKNGPDIHWTSVGDWEPASLSKVKTEWKKAEWTIPAGIDLSVSKQIKFQYRKGDNVLEMKDVILFEDGAQVAQDAHAGATGDADIDNVYHFELPATKKDAKFTIQAQLHGDGGVDSHGTLYIADTKTSPVMRGVLPRDTVLAKDTSWTFSSVIGVAPKSQMRRAFLYYLERERAHTYRPFLHYNSWYDLGYFTMYNEKDCVGVIETYARELAQKRGVVLSSFLFDDGWDDTSALWSFHKGFPDGFTPLKEAAGKANAAPGVWLSPFGGYGKVKARRLEFGKTQGYEINDSGFSLSGPKYYARFREICMDMIKKYGINQFKFDGLGGNGSGAGDFVRDFNAAMHLISELRAASPDLYINLTTGTWPSPFWLTSADSIWRGAEDHDFFGVGTWRQKWMTYRDKATYQDIVRQAPLYPINSLMLHGVIYATHANHLMDDPGNDFDSDVWSFFTTGTQLQEMYITPKLLNDANWDSLAKAAKWARANAATLVDTHWIGGDPSKLEVYGHAAWSPGKGVLALRNPSDAPAEISIDLETAFELPADAPKSYRLSSPRDAAYSPEVLKAGTPHVFKLKPFEVLVFDAVAE